MSLYNRIGIALLASAIEDTGLIIWLYLLRASPLLIAALLAALNLFIFLSVEHLFTQRYLAGKLTIGSIIRVLGFTFLEVINWAIWLILFSIDSLAASLYFLGGFFVEHQITYNVRKGFPFLNFRDSEEAGRNIALETISEFVGSTLWITIPTLGVVALVIGSTIEHYIAASKEV